MPLAKRKKDTQSYQVSTKEIYDGQTSLAFIIDNEVVQTFICDERMASILQSNPTVVEVKNHDLFMNGPHIGWTYKDDKFYPPKLQQESM
jgi:hypothetical protein